MAVSLTISRGSARKPSKPRRKNVTMTAAQREEAGEGSINKHWRTYFLQALAETSNVRVSADRAGVGAGRAYKVRREHADFRAQWMAALAEGYEHLEMEVLGCLRNPDPARKMDIANALRLLAAHRQTVAKVRADEGGESEQEVLDSIDRFIDEMRERAIANIAVIAENIGLSPADDD